MTSALDGNSWWRAAGFAERLRAIPRGESGVYVYSKYRSWAVGCCTEPLCQNGQVYAFVADLAVVRARAQALVSKLTALDRIYFAFKSNNCLDVLKCIAAAGLGVECVSIGEVCGHDWFLRFCSAL